MAALVLTIATRTAAAALQAYAARAISGLFAPDREGPRLQDLRLQSSTEGAALPIVYGRARLAGQIIWAARFTETATTRSTGGGKGGGPKVTEYAYSVSFAVALGEGPIDGIGRVWADGRPFALDAVSYRLHLGAEDQLPDPLIEAVEGAGEVPAFRGVAYVVFEDFPLDDFGARIPQLSFEVFRSPATQGPRLETLARAVTLIPASGEFAYSTTVIRRDLGPGREQAENVNNARGRPDIEAALDDLQAQLPQCSAVMLVVAWFGDDLRCGACALRPGVETLDKTTRPQEWAVNGLSRAAAHVVSQADGRPVYGGTPSDPSVLEAIAALKARGFAVTLCPFILMDVPPGNAKPDPYGGAEQAAYPWRGRITCHPAPGLPLTPDKTAALAAQAAAFIGTCTPAHFSAAGTTVAYSGPAEWTLRRMVLHYARLAQMAGGVDGFLIGSELRGLTTLRDGAASFPVVTALQALAADARAILGPAVKISYAADWTEYRGHQPQDGTGDVFFHLDALWADANIDAVAIDWYAPLADWRDGLSHLDAQSWPSGHDLAYLDANVEGGEGFDWFYADDAARLAQTRTPITDAAHGKPWVFRVKDLASWWTSQHYDRPGGVESGAPTPWSPQSKPIWLTETGCPAVDKGANQPNVFYDPKSAESALPHFSSGARDDLIQRRALEALLSHWDPAAGHNPHSPVYDAPMLDVGRIHLWTWDARPFPDFPARTEVWGDGPNWRLGHWLTGRMGLAPLAAVVADIAARAGLADADAAALDGLVTGYVLDPPLTARQALEPLAAVHRFAARSRDGRLAFAPKDGPAVATLLRDELVLLDGARRLIRERADAAEQPLEARLRFLDETRDYRAAAALARSQEGRRPALALAAPLVLDHDGAERVARAWLASAAAEAETVRLALPPSALALEAGDLVALEGAGGLFRIRRVEDDLARDVLLERAAAGLGPALAGGEPGARGDPGGPPARPLGLVLDIPLLPAEFERGGPRVAAAAIPWPGAVAVSAGGDAAGLIERIRLLRAAAVGELLWDLYPGPLGRWDEGNYVQIRLTGRALASVDKPAALNGANAMALETAPGRWEILQFRQATLVGADVYEIRGLLRGLQGSNAEMGAPTAAGARLVLLDGASEPVALPDHERGVSLLWRFAAAGRALSAEDLYDLAAAYESLDLRPLSPVHVRGVRETVGVRFHWVRRTRIGGDDWAGLDVPLGEAEERYLFELLAGATPVWSAETTAPEALLSTAEEAALFPGGPHYAFAARVAQLSPAYGAGAAWAGTVHVG